VPVEVEVAGDWAFVLSAYSGLTTVNVADPAAPIVADSIEIPEGLCEAVVSGNWLYLCGDGGLGSVDVTDPAHPLPGSGYTPEAAGEISGIALSGDHLFAVGYLPHLYVLDVRDPHAIAPAGSLAVSGSPIDVVVAGDRAFVSNSSPPGLAVYDVRDPVHPVHETTVPAPEICAFLTVVGDRLYAGAGPAGLHVFDISSPSSPVVLSTTDTPAFCHGTEISGDHAFAFDDVGGLRVLEVLQRRVDTLDNVGQSLPAPLPVQAIAGPEITEVRLLATQEGDVTWEISATDGLHWQPITPDGAWHAVEHPGLALLWRSTHLYTQAGVNPTVTEVLLEWNDVGLDAGDIGTMPGALALHGAAPNPFRTSTRIAFDLPAATAARLEVYDVTGRLVRTLASGELPAGRHRSAWSGRDDRGRPVAGGIYFVRLQAGDRELTRRVLRVR
jgi:hypothetical protein